MDLLTILNTWSAAIITVSTGIVLFASSFYYWTKSSRQRRKDEDSAEDRIRKLLYEELKLQNEKIATLTATMEDQKKELEDMKTTQKRLSEENENYLDIFRGRDLDAVAFRKEGRESMQLVRENSKQIIKLLEHMDKMYSLLKAKLDVSDEEIAVTT